MAEPPSKSAPPPPRRPDRLQILWLAAILLAIGGAFYWKGGPRVVADWPGRGPKIEPPGWDRKRAEFARRESEEKGAVVFAGDSITEWWTGLAAAFPGMRAANRGIAGDTTRGLLYRFESDVLALEPAGIVLLAGTNDLHFGARPEEIAFNVREILELVERRRPGTPVVLCLVMPRAPRPGLFPDLILDLNARLRAIASVRPGVLLCDTWTPFADEIGAPRPEEFPDGLHPGPAGYAQWADALAPALGKAGLLR